MSRNKKERKRLKKEKIQNRKLCRRYPFLIPRNVWTGKIVWEQFKDTSKYEYTELDCLEPGWRKAFGTQICEELRQALLKANLLSKYHIMQIKEKFGELRWYDGGGIEETEQIIHKYRELSRHTCYVCGAPGEIINDDGWDVTMCPKCYEKMCKTRERHYANYKMRQEANEQYTNKN